MSAIAAVGGVVTTIVSAAFRTLTGRVDSNEKEIAALKQGHHDASERLARVDQKMDELTTTVHSIDKNIATLVAQGSKDR